MWCFLLRILAHILKKKIHIITLFFVYEGIKIMKYAMRSPARLASSSQYIRPHNILLLLFFFFHRLQRNYDEFFSIFFSWIVSCLERDT